MDALNIGCYIFPYSVSAFSYCGSRTTTATRARSRIDGLSRAIVNEENTSKMAPVNPLANWEKVGDSFYRKIRVYDAIFDDDVELENYLVAGAPYGGAIGMSVCCQIFGPRLNNQLL